MQVDAYWAGKYKYELTGAQRDALIVTDLLLNSELGSLRAVYGRVWRSVRTHPGLLTGFGPATRMLEDPGFRTLRRESRQDDQELVRLYFELSPRRSQDNSDAGAPLPVVRTGWIDLMPRYFFLPRAWQMELKFPTDEEFATWEQELQYTFDQAPIPLVTSSIKRISFGPDRMSEEWQYDYVLVGEYVPTKAIILTAYGFPEPPEVLGPRTPW